MKLYHKELSDQFPNGIDALICSASFESRCLSIPLSLPSNAVARALVFEGDTNVGELRNHARQLREHFDAAATPVCIDLSDPLSIADGVFQSLAELGADAENILVDITTFTRETLLIILRTLYDVLSDDSEVYLAYTSAKEYAVGLSEDDKWLAKGITEIRSVMGYPGSMVPTRKFHLVVMVGFEHERATKLIETFEPSALSLGFGAPGISINETHQHINAAFHRRLVNIYGPVNSFEFSCIDPEAVYAALNQQIKAYSYHNVVIAPLNTKISVIGAGLSALHNEDVQLCYAPATAYNVDGYSVPGEDCYLFSVADLIRGDSKYVTFNSLGQ